MDLLVDSAIYIGHIKKGIDIRQLLVPFLQDGRLYNCGIVRGEVLRGIKGPRVRDTFEGFFDIVPEVPTDAKLWRAVSHMAWHLDRSGHNLPLTDIVIACCAQRVGAVVVSPDQHFQRIDGLNVVTALPSR